MCAQTPCKGAPLAKALNGATLLVEWSLTPRGKAIPHGLQERAITSATQREMVIKDGVEKLLGIPVSWITKDGEVGRNTPWWHQGRLDIQCNSVFRPTREALPFITALEKIIELRSILPLWILNLFTMPSPSLPPLWHSAPPCGS